MTDHHGKTTTGTAVNVRPPTDAKRRHGTDYCAIAQIAVNRDNVILSQCKLRSKCLCIIWSYDIYAYKNCACILFLCSVFCHRVDLVLFVGCVEVRTGHTLLVHFQIWQYSLFFGVRTIYCCSGLKRCERAYVYSVMHNKNDAFTRI